MPYTGSLVSPSGREYPLTFDNEPTQEDLNDAAEEITRREADTGQSGLEAFGASAAKGALGLIPSVTQGLGAVLPGEGGDSFRRQGKTMQAGLDEAFPVDPGRQDDFSARAAGALGQGAAFLGGALLSGGSTIPILGVAGLSGAASGADVADELDLEGWRRGLAVGGFGLAEGGIEAIGGVGSSQFLKGAGRPLFEGVKAVATEGLVEEPLTGAAQDAIRYAATIGTDKPGGNPNGFWNSRFEEALYGTIGALPFGGVAAFNANRLQGSKVVAVVDGEVTDLPDDITEKQVRDMGIDPKNVRVVDQDFAEALRAARSSGSRKIVASVLGETAPPPATIFDAPAPTLEELSTLDEEELPEEEPAPPLETINPAMEGSAPGGVVDPGTSATGPATGSTAPAVSISNPNADDTPVNEEVKPPVTVEDLATSTVTAPRNVDPAAFRARARQEVRPAPESTAIAITQPANPIQVGTAKAHMLRTHGLGNNRVNVVNRPDMKVRGWFDGKTGKPVLNAAWIKDENEASEVLFHEVVHRIEDDPSMRPEINTVMKAIPQDYLDHLDGRLVAAGYMLNELPSERAAVVLSELANNFRTQPAWKRFVAHVRRIWRQLTGKPLSRKDAESVAARILAKAVAQLRRGDAVVQGPVNGNVRRSAPMADQDADYLAAVERGDMETAQRMVDEAAKAAGYNIGPVMHGTAADFTTFRTSGESNVQPWRFKGRNGVFFTENEGEASGHAIVASLKTEGEPRVKRFYIRIKNPYQRSTGGKKAVPFADQNWQAIQRRAEATGADGVIIEDKHPEGHRIFIVYNAENIKSADPVTRDENGNVIPLSKRFNTESDDIRYSRPLNQTSSLEEREIITSAPEIAKAAQQVYDEWDQDGDGHSDELGTGGICDLIAQEISAILSGKGFNIVDGGQEGDDHAYIFAEKNGKVFAVDIAPNVYEVGGGYSWRKKPNVVFQAEHVDVGEVPYEDVFGEPPEMRESVSTQGQSKLSRPLLPGPTETPGPTSQVFGRKGTARVTPSSQKRVVPVVREKFFDSTAGISEENTLKATNLIATLMGAGTGPALADQVRASVDPTDRHLAVGALRRELDDYGLALLAEGDKTIFELMQRYATTDFYINLDSTGRPVTFRDVAQELAGNSRLPGSPAANARDLVNKDKHETNAKVLGEEGFKDVRDTVDSTKLDEAEAASIGETKLPSGETLDEKVTKLSRKRRAKKKRKPSEEEEKAKSEADAAQRQAETILNTLAKSQADPQSNQPRPKMDTVWKIYRRALGLKITDENLATWLDSKLSGAGVEAPVLEPLIKAIITERTNRNIWKNAKAAEGLAEGERGSLAGLAKALTDVPAMIQRQPAWRRRLILDYFMQSGLSKANAEMFARVYEQEFATRLAEATNKAVRGLLDKELPWVRKVKASPIPNKKRVSKELERVLHAARLGLTNPYIIWDEETARQNKWKGFTAEQHRRLEEIDYYLMNHHLADNERAQHIHEINAMIVKAKVPPTTGDKILAAYVASALSGVSTIMVQPSAHVGGVVKAIIAIAADPLDAPAQIKALKNAVVTTASETAFAYSKKAYRNDILETLKGHEKPLELALQEGLKNIKSGSPANRAKGLVQVAYGSQEYIMRALASIDQGYITAAEEWSATMFTKDILRQFGMTRQQANQIIEEALREKDALYADIRQMGYDPLQAHADATDVFIRRLYESIADRNITLDGMNSVELADDMLKAIRLESEGQTGRVSQGEGVGPTDEGVLRQIILYPLKGIAEAQGKGGYLALAMRMGYGFISIPLRTAGWYAGYSPYGFIRYGLHKFQTGRGKTSPYAQSYGTRAQVRQRLREATAGTVAMIVLAALATATADDDENDKNALFVTGGGPDDETLREAWLRRFKPYSIVVKVGGKYHSFNYGRMFESVGWAATLAGTIDDVHIRRKAKEARGTDLDYLDAIAGNTLGNMTERSSFKGMLKFGELVVNIRRPGSSKKAASQAAFSASALVPWKGAMSSVQRLYADPVDNETLVGSILANAPVAGPLIGRPRVNTLGDPVGDLSAGGRAFTLGFPSFGSPQGGKAYDLIFQHGRGPSTYQRNQFSKTFQTEDTDAQFHEFVVRRGRKIKSALESNYDRLKDVDSETFAAFLEALSRSVNSQVASEMKLTRSAK